MTHNMIVQRPYCDDDLPLLQQALAQWIRRAGDCGYCHVGDLPHRIYENLRHKRNVGDYVTVWEEGDDIIGMAIQFRFGCAFDVFTAPHYRGTDVESQMLRSAAQATVSHMQTAASFANDSFGELWVTTDVYTCDDARIALLKALGFEQFRQWDYVNERSLSDALPPPDLPREYHMRSAKSQDAEQLARARNSAFGGNPDDNWTGDEYEREVMQKPGYDPNNEWVVIAPNGDIAAFTVIRLDPVNHIGLFEPVGTHRNYQRKGLARALMSYALNVMRNAGMKIARIEHDMTNAPALALYRGLGFRLKYETVGFRRSALTNLL